MKKNYKLRPLQNSFLSSRACREISLFRDVEIPRQARNDMVECFCRTFKFHVSRSQLRASALLLVLWAIAIMTATIIGIVGLVSAGLDENFAHEKDFRLQQLAESGIAVALSVLNHPGVSPTDSVLKQDLEPNESFEVVIKSEGDRLQINELLENDRRRILFNLFQSWELDLNEADSVIDCLMDWFDGDDLHLLNGAERSYYEEFGHPEYPRNGPFHSIEEMALVKGMDIVMSKKPDWKDYFTVWGDNKLDMNEAPADLISSVCQISIDQAEAFVQQRLGPDKEPHTIDDVRFTDKSQVQAAFGMDERTFKRISDLITVKSPIQRIESTGIIRYDQAEIKQEIKRKIVVVVRRETNPPQILSWQEL